MTSGSKIAFYPEGAELSIVGTKRKMPTREASSRSWGPKEKCQPERQALDLVPRRNANQKKCQPERQALDLVPRRNANQKKCQPEKARLLIAVSRRNVKRACCGEKFWVGPGFVS
jgi:hypothetical protein